MKSELLYSIFSDKQAGISKSIIRSSFNYLHDNFQKAILEELDKLAAFMGERCFLLNITPKDVKIMFENTEYEKCLGYSIFITGEKYDDVRGLMLNIVKECNIAEEVARKLAQENEDLKKQLSDIRNSLNPILKSSE